MLRSVSFFPPFRANRKMFASERDRAGRSFAEAAETDAGSILDYQSIFV